MSVLIKDIQLNSSEIIRIEVSEFKGKELINIRIWYQAVDGKSGDVVYKPTQKGVALNIAEFDKLGLYIRDRHSGSVPDQPKSEHVMKEDEIVEEDEESEEK